MHQCPCASAARPEVSIVSCQAAGGVGRVEAGKPWPPDCTNDAVRRIAFKLTFKAERPPPSQLVQQELLMAAEERGEYF